MRERWAGVVEFQGNSLDGVAGGEQARSGDHAFALKPLARGATEVLLAEAFHGTQGAIEKLRGAIDVPLGTDSKRPPKVIGGAHGVG